MLSELYSDYDEVAVKVANTKEVQKQGAVLWDYRELLQECRFHLFMALDNGFLEKFSDLSDIHVRKLLYKRVKWDLIDAIRRQTGSRLRISHQHVPFSILDIQASAGLGREVQAQDVNIMFRDFEAEDDFTSVEWEHLKTTLAKVLFEVCDEREIDILHCDTLLAAGNKWGITESRACQIRSKAIKKIQKKLKVA